VACAVYLCHILYSCNTCREISLLEPLSSSLMLLSTAVILNCSISSLFIHTGTQILTNRAKIIENKRGGRPLVNGHLMESIAEYSLRLNDTMTPPHSRRSPRFFQLLWFYVFSSRSGFMISKESAHYVTGTRCTSSSVAVSL